MTMRTTTVTAGWDMVREVIPRHHLAQGVWPEGELAPDAPPAAHLGLAIARALKRTMKARGLTARQIARMTGASHPTVGRMLNGSQLPNATTILTVEIALQTELYPRDLYRQLTLDVRD